MGKGTTESQSKLPKIMQGYGRQMVVLAALLVAISLLTNGGPGPADWLVDWTNWAFAFFGITIGGRALVWGGNRLRNQCTNSN